MPAIDRYQSPRINHLCERASGEGIQFFILSGKYGLLRPSDPIKWYDKLLGQDIVCEMAEQVAGQIKSMNIESVLYFTEDPEIESNLRPYKTVIVTACGKADVQCQVRLCDSKGVFENE
jgi:hypothetical protein